MHSPSAIASAGASSASVASESGTAASRAPMRVGATLVLGGVLAALVVTQFHPSREAPNDHHAAFAEYAQSHSWIMVHLGQFAAGLIVIAGILGVLRALRPTGVVTLLTKAAEMAAITTAAVLAVLQGIDGVALKHAVDALAAAPPELQTAAFHNAEIVRWIEWSMAGYYRIAFGLTAILVALAVTRSRALPRWTALLAAVSGVSFVLDGVNVSNVGFAGATVPNLAAWAGLFLFALTATAAAWWRPRRPIRTADPAPTGATAR